MMIYEKYRKKPPIVEAIQYTGDPQEIMYFVGHDLKITKDKSLLGMERIIKINDWIIKDKQGEIQIINSNTFEGDYELIRKER